MAINSRSKGKRGERKICAVLKEWTSYDFNTVPASGGLRWKKAENITGDVICTDPLHRFDFSVESKNYRAINFDHLIIPNVNSDILHVFWPQTLRDAQRGVKIPLLLMRYDNLKPGNFYFAMITYSFYKEIRELLPKKHKYIKVNKLVIMSSLDLFSIDYKVVKKITRKIIKRKHGLTNKS